ncbi:MAG: methyltransferase domain-containing protein [Thermoanaerobaculia bacterium]
MWIPAPVKRVLKPLLREYPHPLLDREEELGPRDRQLEAAYERAIEGFFLQTDESFVRARYREACRERRVVEALAGERLDARPTLDVGSGNGAFELAMGVRGRVAIGVEPLWNPPFLRVARETGMPVRRVVADASRLPFRDGTFGAVTCFDALEHFRDAAAIGSEAVRVASPDGLIFVTTPSRLRYLFRRDPHYGIRGLVLLPSKWQQRLVRRRGFGELYHTERIYGSVPSIARLFPGARVHAVVSRWKVMRRWLWDFVVLEK